MKARWILPLLGAWLAAWSVLAAGPLAPAGDLHGDFVQEKSVSGLPKPFRSRGSFVLMKGHGLVWRTLSPLRGTVVLGAQGVWALDSAGVSRRLAGGGEALELMGKLLAQDQAGLERLFQVSAQAGPSGFHDSLVPKAPLLRKVFRRVEIWGPAAGRVDKAVLSESSGDSTVIRFSGVEAGAAALDPKEEALLAP
jgi:hypothetical protein